MIGKLFIISAPSGAGKTTLLKDLLDKTYEYSLERVVTYTTKSPRLGEKNGVDYHFVSDRVFENLIKKGFFLEWSKAYTYYYGSPRNVLKGIKNGLSYIVILDRLGAQQVIKEFPEAILIWIYTTNFDILRDRLIKRGTENSDQISKRLKQAKMEIQLEHETPLYHYHVLNENYTKALHKLYRIVSQNLNKNTIQNRLEKLKIFP